MGYFWVFLDLFWSHFVVISEPFSSIFFNEFSKSFLRKDYCTFIMHRCNSETATWHDFWKSTAAGHVMTLIILLCCTNRIKKTRWKMTFFLFWASCHKAILVFKNMIFMAILELFLNFFEFHCASFRVKHFRRFTTLSFWWRLDTFRSVILELIGHF